MESVDLKIRLIKKEKQCEVFMIGRLNSSTAYEAEEILLNIVDRFYSITLNMEELKYISSSGLRVLKKMYMKSVKENKIIKIKKASKFIMETFEMTGFVSLFTFI